MEQRINWRHNVAKFGEWVQVVYPLSLKGTPDDPEPATDAAAKAQGARRLGSGAGYGQRDIDYCLGDDRDAAARFVEELKVLLPSATVKERDG